MLDSQQLFLLKEKNRGHKLIYIRFNNQDYVFRDMTPKEYKYITSIYSQDLQIEDAICDLTCVYPDDIDEFAYCGYAGLVSNAANAVIKYSGVNNPLYAMEIYKAMSEIDSLEAQCMDMIKAFVKDYSYEEMEEWTYDKLMYMTIKAERIARLQGFTWHVQDTTDKFNDEFDKINIDNDEFNFDLLRSGHDPIMFYRESLEQFQKEERTMAVPEQPVISGNEWKNEELLNAIRAQIRTSQASRRT
jgi:hypothetical protein